MFATILTRIFAFLFINKVVFICLIFMSSCLFYINTYRYSLSHSLCFRIVKITEYNMQNYQGKLKGLEYRISSVNYKVTVKSIEFGGRSGFKFQVCHWLPVWPGAVYLVCPSGHFLVYKVQMTIISVFWTALTCLFDNSLPQHIVWPAVPYPSVFMFWIRL